MPATTLDIVEAAFRVAIEGMTPRTVAGQATRPWKFYEGQHPTRHDARWFKFEWDSLGYTPGGFMGPTQVDTSATLTIVTDYGGIAEHQIKRIAEDDLYQIRDVLNRLKSAVDGFRWLEAVDWDFDPRVPDRNQARILHQFLVRYMKARG